MRAKWFLRWAAFAAMCCVGLGQSGSFAQDEAGQADGGKRIETRVEVGDGKIVIIDGNGERREIDVTGAQSIVLSRGAKRIVQDGKEDLQTFGKAIVMGPDGNKIEIDLSEADLAEEAFHGRLLRPVMPLIEFGTESGPVFMGNAQVVNRFYIGVHCVPVDETLAVQLGLTPGLGLVVKGVTPDSPAANRGIVVNDIILNADDKELTTQDELASVVNQAGESGAEISLTIVREGQDVQIKLIPAERKTAMVIGAGDGEGELFKFGALRVEGIGPGIIRGEFDAHVLHEWAERMKQFDVENAKLIEELKGRAAEVQEKIQQEWQQFRLQQPNLEGISERVGALGMDELRQHLKEMAVPLEAARSELQTLREKMAGMIRGEPEKELKLRG
ncbi:MAG TPA: PDZ domain-containing protein, partial [Pirellulaceae bacterium]|nr:PDZ domain-containing protein [Pirellulaceae bacterium]